MDRLQAAPAIWSILMGIGTKARRSYAGSQCRRGWHGDVCESHQPRSSFEKGSSCAFHVRGTSHRSGQHAVAGLPDHGRPEMLIGRAIRIVRHHAVCGGRDHAFAAAEDDHAGALRALRAQRLRDGGRGRVLAAALAVSVLHFPGGAGERGWGARSCLGGSRPAVSPIAARGRGRARRRGGCGGRTEPCRFADAEPVWSRRDPTCCACSSACSSSS